MYKRVLAVIVVFCFSISVIGCNSTKNVVPSVNVSLAKLVNDYDSNEVEAKNKYEGKEISSFGTVTNVAIIGNTVGVNLKTDDVTSEWKIMCIINKVAEPDAYSKLQTSKNITFSGIVERIADQKFIHIINCRLAK